VRGHSLTVQQCPRPKLGVSNGAGPSICGPRQLNLGASAGWEVSSATKAQACVSSFSRRTSRTAVAAAGQTVGHRGRLFRAMAADRTRRCRYRPLEVEARPAAEGKRAPIKLASAVGGAADLSQT